DGKPVGGSFAGLIPDGQHQAQGRVRNRDACANAAEQDLIDPRFEARVDRPEVGIDARGLDLPQLRTELAQPRRFAAGERNAEPNTGHAVRLMRCEGQARELRVARETGPTPALQRDRLAGAPTLPRSRTGAGTPRGACPAPRTPPICASGPRGPRRTP